MIDGSSSTSQTSTSSRRRRRPRPSTREPPDGLHVDLKLKLVCRHGWQGRGRMDGLFASVPFTTSGALVDSVDSAYDQTPSWPPVS